MFRPLSSQYRFFLLSPNSETLAAFCSQFSALPCSCCPASVTEFERERTMDGEPLGNGGQADNRVLEAFQKSFVQVQSILDQNRLLINEINMNHESKIPSNVGRNVGLIRELNSNIRRVVGLYADLSASFAGSMEASSEGDYSAGTLRSDGKLRHKRIKP